MICHVIRVQHRRALLVMEPRESTVHYTLKDHQGNLTATISGNTVERLSYDAWGNLRDPETWTNGQNALSLSPIIKCFV